MVLQQSRPHRGLQRRLLLVGYGHSHGRAAAIGVVPIDRRACPRRATGSGIAPCDEAKPNGSVVGLRVRNAVGNHAIRPEARVPSDDDDA